MFALKSELIAFQTWLNDHGAPEKLEADGNFGPKSKAAMLSVFSCQSAKAVTDEDLAAFATRLGCSVAQIKAVAFVESNGGGWDKQGRIMCLYERHYVWKRVRAAVPFLSDPKPGGYTVDADHDGINDSWEKLADAVAFWGPSVAFECASFGKFQVMGAQWNKLGYPSAMEFVWGMVADEKAHYECLARYVEYFGLKRALQKMNASPLNCRDFAIGYNGPKQKGYDARLASAVVKMSSGRG